MMENINTRKMIHASLLLRRHSGCSDDITDKCVCVCVRT